VEETPGARNEAIVASESTPPKKAKHCGERRGDEKFSPPKADAEKKTPRDEPEPKSDRKESPKKPPPSRSIRVLQENPKRRDSKSWTRYEAYKVATTTTEYLALGGTRADLAYDSARGFVEYVDAPPVAESADRDEIHFAQANPHQPGTAAYDRYEAFKSATTRRRFFDLGGTTVDLEDAVSAGAASLCFWREVGSACRFQYKDTWYDGTVVEYDESTATIAYTQHKGYIAIIPLDQVDSVNWS